MKHQQTRTETEFRSLACSSTDHKQPEEREQGNQSERHMRDEPIRYSPGVGVGGGEEEKFREQGFKGPAHICIDITIPCRLAASLALVCGFSTPHATT